MRTVELRNLQLLMQAAVEPVKSRPKARLYRQPDAMTFSDDEDTAEQDELSRARLQLMRQQVAQSQKSCSTCCHDTDDVLQKLRKSIIMANDVQKYAVAAPFKKDAVFERREPGPEDPFQTPQHRIRKCRYDDW